MLVAAPTLAVAYMAAHWGRPLSSIGAAGMQGVFAALLTCMWGLAPWWRAIQLLFPPMLVGANELHPPPALLLSAFVLLLLLFWSTFRTQVPFFPSGPAAWEAVAALVPPDRRVRLIDIGSGLGGLVIELARQRPQADVSGIELAPLPWLVSVLRARWSSSAARFVRGDYEQLDFADFDVVFAYLSPAAMTSLWHKAQREMRPAAMLVSYEFSIPERPPDRVVAATGARRAMYVWYF